MAAFWSRLNTLLLLLVLLVLGAMVALLATRAEGGPLDPTAAPNSTDGVLRPGTPITGPTTIDAGGYFYLTRNINSGVGAPIIIIDASNVTLDLNGFGVRGGNDTIGSIGIYIQPSLPEHTNIEIRNGIVRDFHVGISADDGMFVRIKDVHVFSNIRGIELGTQSLLEGCSSMANSEAGVYVPTAEFSNTIRQCQVIGNSGHGIDFDGDRNVVTDSYVLSNQGGFDLDFGGNKNVVRDSYIGEVFLDGDRNMVLDNACITATALNSGVGNVVTPADHANLACFP
jgi:hypothetical protein